MSIQEVKHTFRIGLGVKLADTDISSNEIGTRTGEFCEATSVRCSRVGGCVIGAMTSIEQQADEDMAHVDLSCVAWLKTQSLEGCRLAEEAPFAVDASLQEFMTRTLATITEHRESGLRS